MKAQVVSSSQTLNESVCDTLLRDLKNIFTKLRYVIVPKFSVQKDDAAIKELRNWDLWGPLLLCLLLSLIINLSIPNNGKSFGVLFMIVWGGAFVVTVNTKLLGGKISFFQCVCVLGYCIFPIVLGALVAYIFKLFNADVFFIKLIISGVSLVWATIASVSFMNVLIESDKKIIAIYPIFLFYLFIDWFILFI